MLGITTMLILKISVSGSKTRTGTVDDRMFTFEPVQWIVNKRSQTRPPPDLLKQVL